MGGVSTVLLCVVAERTGVGGVSTVLCVVAERTGVDGVSTVLLCVVAERTGVDGVAAQQFAERDPRRRDGTGEDDPDNRAHLLPDGKETAQRTVPHHRSSLVRVRRRRGGGRAGAAGQRRHGGVDGMRARP